MENSKGTIDWDNLGEVFEDYASDNEYSETVERIQAAADGINFQDRTEMAWAILTSEARELQAYNCEARLLELRRDMNMYRAIKYEEGD